MRAHWAYLKYILRHKWYVFLECCSAGIPLKGILHDWHKFLPSEFLPYVHFFHNPDGSKRSVRTKTGYYKPTDTGDKKFDQAWFLHQKRSDHHWQYWCLPEDIRGLKVIPMPSKARREMLCDWRGAGRAQGTPDVRGWWDVNKGKLQLHPETRKWIEEQLQ